jgi:hypothetical protein
MVWPKKIPLSSADCKWIVLDYNFIFLFQGWKPGIMQQQQLLPKTYLRMALQATTVSSHLNFILIIISLFYYLTFILTILYIILLVYCKFTFKYYFNYNTLVGQPGSLSLFI